MKRLLALAALLLVVISRTFAGDTLNLTDGEVVQGDVVSQTESQVVIRVSNASGTITSLRIIPISSIKDFKIETAQEREERQASQELSQFKLDPNSELAKADYAQGIAAFDKYLKTYPQSKQAGEIRQRMAAWKVELSNIEKGLVKFDNRWMTPAEKEPLWYQYLAERENAKATAKNQSTQLKLQQMEAKRAAAVADIASLNAVIVDRRAMVALFTRTAPMKQDPVYVMQSPSSGVGLAKKVQVGYRWVVDQEKIDKAASDLARAQSELGLKQQDLVKWDTLISAEKARTASPE